MAASSRARQAPWPGVPEPGRRVLAVFVGGMLGGAARIAVSLLLDGRGWLPWGTLVENVSGALLLGYVLTRVLRSEGPTSLHVPLLCTGVLGSYTTFSTFSLEAWQLLQAGRPVLGLGYAGLSLALGLAAAALGMHLAEVRR